MVKIASLKGFLLLWKSKLKELLKRLKNWLKRYWIKKTINKFMIIPIMTKLNKIESEKQKQEEVINEQLREAIKTKENSVYYGAYVEVDIYEDAQSYLDSTMIFIKYEYLNAFMNFCVKSIHRITQYDIAIYPDIMLFVAPVRHVCVIDIYLFCLIILFFYIFYRIIKQLSQPKNKILDLGDLFLLKLHAFIILGTILIIFLLLIYNFNTQIDIFLTKHFRKEELFHSYVMPHIKIVTHTITIIYVIPIEFLKINLFFSLNVFSKIVFYYIIFVLFFAGKKMLYEPAISGLLAYNQEKNREQMIVKKATTPILAKPSDPNDLVTNHPDYKSLHLTYEEWIIEQNEKNKMKESDKKFLNDMKIKKLEEAALKLRAKVLADERTEKIINTDTIKKLREEEITELKREKAIIKNNYELIDRKIREIDSLKEERKIQNAKILENNKQFYEQELLKANKIEEYEKKNNILETNRRLYEEQLKKANKK
jgi:hypothetical protein